MTRVMIPGEELSTVSLPSIVQRLAEMHDLTVFLFGLFAGLIVAAVALLLRGE